jgi:hypothetical protein
VEQKQESQLKVGLYRSKNQGTQKLSHNFALEFLNAHDVNQSLGHGLKLQRKLNLLRVLIAPQIKFSLNQHRQL